MLTAWKLVVVVEEPETKVASGKGVVKTGVDMAKTAAAEMSEKCMFISFEFIRE
jgi:hypothetical protein